MLGVLLLSATGVESKETQAVFVKGKVHKKTGNDDKSKRITFPHVKVEYPGRSTKQKIQYICVKDVPVGTDWEKSSVCPQDDDGDCCNKETVKSQLIGLLLQFFLGAFGAGYFYYGDIKIGIFFVAAFLLLCTLQMSIFISSGTMFNALKADSAKQAEIGSSAKSCGQFVSLCTCGLFYLVLIGSWVVIITKGVLPENGCPLDCDL